MAPQPVVVPAPTTAPPVAPAGPIPLAALEYKAHVAGLSAEVTCRQKYRNTTEKAVEAVYVFPLPEEASVTACVLQIGSKRIEAELKKREEARREYEAAVEAGHHASLLEQERPNIFTMNVGGIEPGEDVDVTVTYQQRVTWQDSGGRFTIPLVVAPRFIPGTPVGKAGGGWAEDTDAVPDASRITPVVAKDGVPYAATVRVQLSPGFGCAISSPSHGELVGDFLLAVGEAKELTLGPLTPDRDVILCYRTAAPGVELATHVGRFGEEHFAAVTVLPPNSVAAKARRIELVLDCSGSMAGAKIAGLKVVAEKLVEKVRAQSLNDEVGIIAFDDSILFEHALEPVTDETREAIRRLQSHGGTYAGKALNHAFQKLGTASAKDRFVVLVTDGQTEDRWSKVPSGVRVIAVGIDTAINMEYLSSIARESGGTELAVYPGEDYDRVANTVLGFLSGPVLRDVRVTAEGIPIADVLGVRDVFKDLPAVITLRTGAPVTNVTVSGIGPDGKQRDLPVDLAAAPAMPFCHQIWAREKLRVGGTPAEQVGISLRYSVLCSHTAFVAVSVKEVPGQKPERVEVPVNLPYTWDYDAVFGRNLAAAGLVTGGGKGFRSMRLAAVRGYGQNVLGASSGDGTAYADSVDSMLQEFHDDGGDAPLGASLELDDMTVETPEADIVTALEAFVAKCAEGQTDRTALETEWQTLLTRLTSEADTLTVTEKAKCYALLLRLRPFAFTAPQELLAKVSARPLDSEPDALRWWQEAQRSLGVKVS